MDGEGSGALSRPSHHLSAVLGALPGPGRVPVLVLAA